MRNGFELLGGIKSGAIHAAMVGAANLEETSDVCAKDQVAGVAIRCCGL